MARYYAATIRTADDKMMQADGPYENHTRAMGFHTRVLAMEAMPMLNRQHTQDYRRVVMLDTGSVPGDMTEEQWRELLMEDPVLYAVHQLGLQHGMAQARELFEQGAHGPSTETEPEPKGKDTSAAKG